MSMDTLVWTHEDNNEALSTYGWMIANVECTSFVELIPVRRKIRPSELFKEIASQASEDGPALLRKAFVVLVAQRLKNPDRVFTYCEEYEDSERSRKHRWKTQSP